jgi:hypothetical protein
VGGVAAGGWAIGGVAGEAALGTGCCAGASAPVEVDGAGTSAGRDGVATAGSTGGVVTGVSARVAEDALGSVLARSGAEALAVSADGTAARSRSRS